MNGADFISLVRKHVAPRTISAMSGSATGVSISISDGAAVNIERAEVSKITSKKAATSYIRASTVKA